MNSNTKQMLIDNPQALRALTNLWPMVKPLLRESTASALRINAYVHENPGKTVHAIAATLDYHVDTVHAYLAALEAAGMVKRSSSGEASGVPQVVGGRPFSEVNKTRLGSDRTSAKAV